MPQVADAVMGTCQMEAGAAYSAQAFHAQGPSNADQLELLESSRREWMKDEREDVLARVLAYRSCAHPG